jgi:cell division protein FtsI (penicillin-binding protein 3)
MKVSEKRWIRLRIYSVAFFFLIGLGVVIVRALQLQILERERLCAIADAGYRDTIKLPPTRGSIYDRAGHELALSIEVSSVYAHPHRIKDKGAVAKQLARILGERESTLHRRLKSKSPFVWIKRRIDPDKARQVESLGEKGLGVTAESRRFYPGCEVGAHLIGFTGMDNQGLEGIEKSYDSLLQGPQYSLVQMRDALGRAFSVSRPIPSEHELHSLVLTINKDIQYKAHQALVSTVNRTKAVGGQCLVVDPDTGEILAMSVVPEFNPNIFSEYSSDQWRNRALTDSFEPGSTIKAFLLAAALEEGVVTPSTQFHCEEGKYRIGGHVIHDTHEHGILTVSEIIALSSNIGTVKMGERLGYQKFSGYMEAFGFGSKTGLRLAGERDGYIRPVQAAKPIDQATSYFGQGMTATSLQLAMAMGAIANGGKLMRPYVVKAIVDASGTVVEETRPEVIRNVVSHTTAKRVAKILEEVVGEKGTGSKAAISGFTSAGKTGTSQKVDPETKRYSRSKYVASFVGFAPADRPRLVIVVSIDEPKGGAYGGMVAAPVFSEVGQWTLNYLRIDPQIRVVEEKKSPSEDWPEGPDKGESLDQIPLRFKAGVVPDFRGLSMREVLREGRWLGLQIVPEGSGLAFQQVPLPGSPLTKNEILVSFRPPG